MNKADTSKFLWCAGIEDTFIADPFPATGKTLDEYELTGHYGQWKEDFDRVQNLGVDGLRWGMPWYRVNPEKNKWDWTWTDETIPYLAEEKGITVILDLMHYGTPRWLEHAFVDPDYPAYVEEYTARVIERYGKWLTMATPFNEPHTACEFAGSRGQWPPYGTGWDGYVRVLRGIVYGGLRQTKLLQEAGILCVEVECSGGAVAAEPRYEEQALLERTVQSMYFDFLTGDMEALEPIRPFLLDHGMTQKDLDFFSANGRPIDIMGINYYPQFSFQELYTGEGGGMERRNHQEWTEDLRRIVERRYEKYRCPMIITETSIRDDQDMKLRWLRESADLAVQLNREGLPLIGYTWFPVIDMYDWEYRINPGPKENFKARFGFWDHERNANACVPLYRDIISAYKERENGK
ncbi:family 1 glycosylhydrolase [Breznakiella homolactica]|uniref:Family 1 glycosylhydrolase n=1 Tax=Breznakiella homolactica TaxID=2798577 RepID=A0A7T8BA87_9SPIR|nr:family 1 glycosylhydrolase [Breznakiella homolactica]QQO09111.1 family 1 glycosylhydrolase [Breznakiella homolactica]